MPFRSKLFNRNKGGHAKLGGSTRSGGFFPPNPSPPAGRKQINSREKKQRTFNLQSTPARSDADPSHLDIIAQGTGASQRIGQRSKITGIHIRGEMSLPTEIANRTSSAGYYIVWDRQPNGALAVLNDILDTEVNDVNSVDAFPLASNEARFVILARKTHNFVKQETASSSFDDRWTIDHYLQFNRSLLTTSKNVDELATTPSGGIGTRSSGALLLLPIGDTTAEIPFTYSYRVYFEDV